MRVACSECGEYDIAPALFRELAQLSKSSAEIERLRNQFSKVPEPRVVRKHRTNIVRIEAQGADMPTKLQKRFLRSKSEEKNTSGGAIFYTGNQQDEDSSS